MKKILVVEDHVTTVNQLKQNLEREGYEVYIARRGRDAQDIIAQHRIDLVLLDLGLPDIDGLYVCNECRSAYPLLPIIILSEKTAEHERVRALKLCADDYVLKPFSMDELLARINVQFLHADHMRAGGERRKFTAGPLVVNYAQRRVRVHGELIELTFKEFELLYILVKNHGKLVTYDYILEHVWGDEEMSEWKNIHVYVNRLRKKIETPANRRFIYNEAKIGYRFQAGE
ncbi:MAG: response regulator transcription factor [Ktedonobacteraceae bacterium]